MRAKDIVLGAVLVGGLVGANWSTVERMDLKSPEEQAAKEASVTYSGCNEVRALGKAPLYAGQPGYRPEMDGDGDGIACEPHRRSRSW